jgi:hypothetical protein
MVLIEFFWHKQILLDYDDCAEKWNRGNLISEFADHKQKPTVVQISDAAKI